MSVFYLDAKVSGLDHAAGAALRNQRPERGAVLVELAITLVPFLLLVFVSIVGSVIGLTSLCLYFSVTRAAREASVSTAVTAADRVNEIITNTNAHARGLGVDTANLTVTVCPLLNPNCGGQDPAGGNQYFVVTARKPLGSFWGLGRIAVSARAMARNEPI